MRETKYRINDKVYDARDRTDKELSIDLCMINAIIRQCISDYGMMTKYVTDIERKQHYNKLSLLKVHRRTIINERNLRFKRRYTIKEVTDES